MRMIGLGASFEVEGRIMPKSWKVEARFLKTCSKP